MTENLVRTAEEDAAVRELDAWMSVKLPHYLQKEVMVAFSPRAHLACLKRWGPMGVMVISWDEFVACAKGVAEVEGADAKAKRMREALWHFASRQKITIDD